MSDASTPAPLTLAAAEKAALVAALEETRGNVKAAAALVGCSRSAFYSKLERHGLHERRDRPPTAGQAIAGAGGGPT